MLRYQGAVFPIFGGFWGAQLTDVRSLLIEYVSGHTYIRKRISLTFFVKKLILWSKGLSRGLLGDATYFIYRAVTFFPQIPFPGPFSEMLLASRFSADWKPNHYMRLPSCKPMPVRQPGFAGLHTSFICKAFPVPFLPEFTRRREQPHQSRQPTDLNCPLA